MNCNTVQLCSTDVLRGPQVVEAVLSKESQSRAIDHKVLRGLLFALLCYIKHY